MDRKELYKSASETVNSLRTRRREEQFGLRKEKRGKILNFKRFKVGTNEENAEFAELTVEEMLNFAKSFQRRGTETLKQLKILRNSFTQGSRLAEAFIIADGALQSLVRYLTGNDAEFQIEAAWCLTNLTGATQENGAHVLKVTGAYLITYLRSQNVQLQDLCAWTLGNLAGDGKECRGIIRDQGAVDALLNLLKSSFPNVVQSAAFALGNLARGTGEQVFGDLKNNGIGPLLYSIIKAPSSASAELVSEVCWILTYFTVEQKNVDYLFSSGIHIPLVVGLLQKYLEYTDSVQIVTPLLRSLGNICSGPDEHGVAIVRSGILVTLPKLLSSSSHHVRKETLWLLSNLTAGSEETLVAVLELGLLPVLLEMLDGTFDIRRESAIVLCNIAYKRDEYLKVILNYGGLERFLGLLKSLDNDVAFLALQFFEMMLRSLPESREIFEKAEGVAYLEALQYKRSEEICQCVNDLMSRYFEEEE